MKLKNVVIIARVLISAILVTRAVAQEGMCNGLAQWFESEFPASCSVNGDCNV